MKQLIVLLITSLFTMQAMAITMSKLAQKRKWQQSARMAEKGAEDLEALLKRMQVEQTPVDLNYFQKIRLELNKLAAEEAEVAKTRGVLKSSLIKLPVDTAGFFIATGAINFMAMWNKSGGNPLVFQEQVMNLTDPLATFSFYSFMVANGFYTNFKSDRLAIDLTPETKALALRRISYQAMAAGSFASSVSADIGASIGACAKSWLHPKPASVMVSEKEKAEIDKLDKGCDKALEIWTARKMTEKYLPQIFSLLIVQGATEFLQEGVNKGISMSAKGLYKTILAAGERYGFKMLFVNVALSATPSGWFVKGISIVGKVMQFGFFVGVDHAINNTVTRGFNNFFKPLTFKAFDQIGLDMNFEVGGKYQWNVEKISRLREMFDPTARPDKRTAEGVFSFEHFTDNFPKEIRNFTAQLQIWRDHLNSNAEGDLNSWLAMTNRILTQMQISETYYSTYLKNLFVTSTISYRVNLPEKNPAKLPKEAFNNIPVYPYKTLPLFGVTYVPWAGSNVKEENAYLAMPAETEKGQAWLLKTIATKMRSKEVAERVSYSSESEKMEMKPVKWFHIPGPNRELAEKTLDALQTGNPAVQGLALKEFMAAFKRSIVNNDVEFRKFGYHLLGFIGKPDPKLYEGEGFNAAFELENKTQLESADFDLNDMDQRTNLSTPGQYLTHAMACGYHEGFIQEYALLNGSSDPDFRPPAIVLNQPKELCAQNGGSALSEDFYTKRITNPKTNLYYPNINSYITQNINPYILGDYRELDKDKLKIADIPKWWSERVMSKIPPVLKKWDAEYASLVDAMMTNMFETKVIHTGYMGQIIPTAPKLTRVVDKLTQFNWFGDNLFGSTISESYQFEKEFYLQTVNMVRTKMKFDLPLHGETSMLNEAKKIAIGESSKYLKPLNAPEYVNISSALNALIEELAKPVTYLNPDDQIKSDKQLEEERKTAAGKAKADLEDTQLNYKRYLDLEAKYENAVSALEATVGLKTASKAASDLFSDLPGQETETKDEKKTAPLQTGVITYVPVKIEKPNFEQGVVMAAAEGLRNIEENIAKYVKMKVLMRRGLTFTKDELAKFQQTAVQQAAATKQTCVKAIGGGCK